MVQGREGAQYVNFKNEKPSTDAYTFLFCLFYSCFFFFFFFAFLFTFFHPKQLDFMAQLLIMFSCCVVLLLFSNDFSNPVCSR